MLKLAVMRLRSICERVNSDPHLHILESAYKLVGRALVGATALFFQRHLDTLLLCAVYGVCKVTPVTPSLDPTKGPTTPFFNSHLTLLCVCVCGCVCGGGVWIVFGFR